MKRIAVLTFLIVTIFDWRSIAVTAARAQAASDSQAVTISVPARESVSTPTVVMPAEPSSQVLEIPLPETFAGCWSGDVSRLDSRQSYDWWRPSWFSHWFDKTYTVCFKKRGLNQWSVGFASTAVDPTRFQVTQAKPSRIVAIKMTGSQSAAIDLTADIQFGSMLKTENTRLECSLGTTQSMAVTGSIDEFRNGREEMSATWHADFQPVAVRELGLVSVRKER